MKHRPDVCPEVRVQAADDGAAAYRHNQFIVAALARDAARHVDGGDGRGADGSRGLRGGVAGALRRHRQPTAQPGPAVDRKRFAGSRSRQGHRGHRLLRRQRDAGEPRHPRKAPENLVQTHDDTYGLCEARFSPAFVLDGLLYNESELELEEHYTDTHGYTEINFAALGLRFCPRIRGVQHQRIYRIDPNCDYGSLASLVSRADQTVDTGQIAEHWDRMGQLYASLKTGHVTASVALKRLVSFSAKNRFYRANRDLGRIFKTEFILQYLSEPELRRRIRRGLLKVEQLHALARDVFYGRRGRINARELWEQMNTCSCLNLILACIVYWQACEISRVLSECDPLANGIDLSLLESLICVETYGCKRWNDAHRTFGDVPTKVRKTPRDLAQTRIYTRTHGFLQLPKSDGFQAANFGGLIPTES